MSTEDNAFASLIQDYVAECLPLAEEVADAFVGLEREWQAGNPADELFRSLKSTLHTIKGDSAMMGLAPIQGLAHTLEDLHGLLLRQPGQRLRAASLLVDGGNLLVRLVRGAAEGIATPEAVAPYLADAQRFETESATSPDHHGVPEEPADADRRHSERRAVDRAASGTTDSVRVDVKRLDALLEIFGETMIAQSGLAEVRGRLRSQAPGLAMLDDLDRSVDQLTKSLRHLEGALMETRLFPIASVFGRFGRLVRDVAHSEEKQVRLETAGGDTRLDKTIIDRLGEPLVHLVTNAVIHGIERPAERTRSGKPAEACVTLSAAPRSDRVIVTVHDDGRGLNPARILAKAQALGLNVGATESEEIFALAFLPGLSTAERVSSLAGRGVGLDVVAGAVRALGGTVSLTSESGRGTTFTLVLPLTVLVLRALIVDVAGERYAIALHDVAETVRLGPDALHAIDGRGMMLWRNQLIPVSDAGELLGHGSGRRSARPYCVVVQSSAKRHGVLVDRLLGRHDVVAKGLDSSLGRPPLVSGATILGDGRVACILDTVGLVEQFHESAVASGDGGRS